MIKTEALSFSYDNGIQALSEITFELRYGEFLALMGSNGCGKTTLLKHFNGLLKPCSGKIFLDNKELRLFKDEEIYRRVGMVFQDPDDQLFGASVGQDVAFGAVNLGLNQHDAARSAAQALEAVGAYDLCDRALHTLSFGQKRRVAIAGVLAMQPEIILLDEPTSGLDPQGVSSIMRLLRRLNQEKKITMVMATHDVELVPLFSDRAVIMSKGKVVDEGTPEEVFARADKIRNARLRLPRIGHLFEVLKKHGICSQKLPLTIGEARYKLSEILGSRLNNDNENEAVGSGKPLYEG